MDLKQMIENRMKNTKEEHRQVTAMLEQTERQLTQLTTKRVELASVYNADEELLKTYNAEYQSVSVDPVPVEVIETGNKTKK